MDSSMLSSLKARLFQDVESGTATILSHETIARIIKLMDELKAENRELQYDKEAISRIWKILGIKTYEQAQGKSIDELVAAVIHRFEEVLKNYGCCPQRIERLKNGT